MSEQEESGILEKLAEPLVQYVKQYHHPHTAIIITDEKVAVVETIQSIPILKNSTISMDFIQSG